MPEVSVEVAVAVVGDEVAVGEEAVAVEAEEEEDQEAKEVMPGKEPGRIKTKLAGEIIIGREAMIRRWPGQVQGPLLDALEIIDPSLAASVKAISLCCTRMQDAIKE